MSIDPKVSIIIPTFNRANFLGQAIETALNQTYACEVIVCDHGSTDNTPDFVKHYGERIKYLRRDEDHGPHFCWLDALMNCSGDYVHFTYDDDWLEVDFIEKLMAKFTDEVGFVFARPKIYFDKLGTYGPHMEDLAKALGSKLTDGRGLSEDLAEYLLANNLVISPGCGIFRKKLAISALHAGDLPLAEHRYRGVGPDLMFSLLSLLFYKQYAFIDEPLAIFRAHDASITIESSSSKDKALALKRAYDEAFKYYLLLKKSRDNNLTTWLFWPTKLRNIFSKAKKLKKLPAKLRSLIKS